MDTLYLLASERALCERLPVGVREGWTVADERGTYRDSAAAQRYRLQFVRLHDPKITDLVARLLQEKDPSEAARLIQEMDLEDVSDADLMELFFAMGPTLLTHLISSLLPTVSSDAELERVVALTNVRHALLSNFSQQVS